jgi:hypothetical protein
MLAVVLTKWPPNGKLEVGPDFIAAERAETTCERLAKTRAVLKFSLVTIEAQAVYFRAISNREVQSSGSLGRPTLIGSVAAGAAFAIARLIGG